MYVITSYYTGEMAMCNTGKYGHVFVITSYYTGEVAMCNTGKYGHVYVTTSYDTGWVKTRGWVTTRVMIRWVMIVDTSGCQLGS